MTRIKLTPKTTPDRQRKQLPGQRTTLGQLFGQALSKVEPSTGEHMQTEEYWREVWRKDDSR